MAIRRVAALAPLLIGAPVLVAIVRSVADLVSLGHPSFADVSGTSIDAQSLFLGGPLYQDPAAGYTAQAYPPVLPALSAALDHLRVWTGWPVLIVVLAGLSLAGLAAALAYRPAGPARADRLAAAAGALGFAGLAWWLVASVPFNFLYAPRPDELEWALALGGLALVPAAARGSRGAIAGCVLLLSAACWTKQTAAAACIAALACLVLATRARGGSLRIPVVFAAALLALNLIVFAFLELRTGGWAGRFVVELPGRHPRVVGTRFALHEMVEVVAPALALALLLGGALLLRERRAPFGRGRVWPEGWRAQVGLVLAIFVVLDVLPSAYFRRALGAVANNYVGVAWSLALLAAFLFGECMRRRGTAVFAVAPVAALFALSEIGPAQRWLAHQHVFVRPKAARIVAFDGYAGLRAYARRHSVFHPVFGDLGSPRLYPSHQNFEGLLAAGIQPRYLVDALLDRRFAVAYLLDDSPEREALAGAGHWEDGYLWKLNQVILAKYEPWPHVPADLENARFVPAGVYTYASPGVLRRRPGPDPAPWIRDCFGPFEVAGARWQIRTGGGFWCQHRHRGSVLRLVRTPAPFTEVRAEHARSPAGGALRVTIPTGRGGFGVVTAGWRLTGKVVAGRRVALELVAGGRRAFATLGSARTPITVRFVAATPGAPVLGASGASVTATIPREGRGRLSLIATFNSRATFDLAGLHLGRGG